MVLMEEVEIRDSKSVDSMKSRLKDRLATPGGTLTPALSQRERRGEFVEGVMRSLPDREGARRARWLGRGWRLAPVGLFGVWAFLQAAALVAGGLTLAVGWIPGAERLVGMLLPETGATTGGLWMLPGDVVGAAGGLLAAVQEAASWLNGLAGLSAAAGLFGLVISAVVGMLLVGWMAGEVIRKG